MSMDTVAARSSRPAARCVRTEVRWRWARRGPRRAEDTSRCLGGAADRPHHAGLRGRGHLQPNRAAHQRTIAGWESVASHRPTRVAASGAVRTRRGDGRMVAAVANLGLGGGQKPVRGRHHNGSGAFPSPIGALEDSRRAFENACFLYLLRLTSLDTFGCDGRCCSSRRSFYTHAGSNQAQTTRLTCCLDEPAEPAPSVTAV